MPWTRGPNITPTKNSNSIAKAFAKILNSGDTELDWKDRAQIDAYTATINARNATADKTREETNLLRYQQDPESHARYAGRVAGIDDQTAIQLYRAQRGDKVPLLVPNDDEGSPMPPAGGYAMPENIAPEKMSRFDNAIASVMASAIAPGHTNAAQMTQAGANLWEQIIRQKIASEPSAQVQNQYRAALPGSGYREPYSAVNAQGNVTDQETGIVTPADPALHAAGVSALMKLGEQRGAAAAYSNARSQVVPSQIDRNEAVADRLRAGSHARSVSTSAVAVPSQNVDGNPPITGADYLKTLPPAAQETIKGVAEGRIPMTTFSTKGGHREQIMQMVTQYDPSYNATRSSAWREFTTGPTGRNLVNINQAIGHMGTMYDLAEAMNNKDTRLANSVLNRISTAFGNPQINNFETARQAVAEELMRTFRQVGASEREQAEWLAKFNSSNSPEQLKGAMGVASHLLNSRIKAVNDSWRRASQSQADFPGLLSPENVQTMSKIAGGSERRAPVKAGWSIKAVP